MEIKIKLLSDGANVPRYQTKGSAGVDLHADLSRCSDSVVFPGMDGILCKCIRAGETVVIPCGFAMEIPLGYEGQIRPRSGLTKTGVVVANAPGTVDADYRGEVKVMLYNRGPGMHYLYHGDRCAQMIISRVESAMFIEVEELHGTERGEGGFGSTGQR